LPEDSLKRKERMMKMQGVTWKGQHYIFAYESDTASEPALDFREVMICQMDDRISELEDQISALKNK
jgi:hypothetical protein